MSFAFQDFSRQVMTGQFKWIAYTRVVLVNTSWTPDPAAKFLADIPAPARAITQEVAGRAVVGGAADAVDIAFPRVPAGSGTYGGLVFYQDSGDPATSLLLIFHNEAADWPVTATGGTIGVVIDNGPNRLFRIGVHPA